KISALAQFIQTLLSSNGVVLDQREVEIAEDTAHCSPSARVSDWAIPKKLGHAEKSCARDLAALGRHLDADRVRTESTQNGTLDAVVRIKCWRRRGEIGIGDSEETAHQVVRESCVPLASPQDVPEQALCPLLYSRQRGNGRCRRHQVEEGLQ